MEGGGGVLGEWKSLEGEGAKGGHSLSQLSKLSLLGG